MRRIPSLTAASTMGLLMPEGSQPRVTDESRRRPPASHPAAAPPCLLWGYGLDAESESMGPFTARWGEGGWIRSR
jgi:hypothetical protein